MGYKSHLLINKCISSSLQSQRCYLVLGAALSVSDMRRHNSLSFLAQPREAFQLQTRHTSHIILKTILCPPIILCNCSFFFLNPSIITHYLLLFLLLPFHIKLTMSHIHPMTHLVGALAHSVNQLLDDHVHTLDAGLLQLYDLLLHYGLERHVGGEESGPESHREDEIKVQTVMKSIDMLFAVVAALVLAPEISVF